MSERPFRKKLAEVKIDDPAIALILAEELARDIGREVANNLRFPKAEVVPREVVVPTSEVKLSHTVDKKDYTTSDVYTIVDTKSSGTLKEATVRSTSTNYSIYIEADGIEKIYRTFVELEDISSYLEFIDAFEVDGVYILRIGELHWTNSFRLVLRPSASVLFKNIIALWEEYGA